MGNICRSPTAEGVFRAILARENLEGRVFVDSAGTGGWHAGEAPDRRSQAAALRRGYDLSAQRARQVTLNDFHHFDLILAMDADNLRNLHAIAPASLREKARLLLDFADPPPDTLEVPDPYFGDDGFDHVLDLVEAGCEGLLTRVRTILDASNGRR
jgi:protein-tyrosine phosphatase